MRTGRQAASGTLPKHALTLWTLLGTLAIASGALAEEAADPWSQVLGYKFDQPRTATAAIEAEIRAAAPDELRAIEAKLLGLLEDPTATTDCKDWACRQLRQVGSERSVAALAPLLADKDLATVARWALQSIPGGKVDEALRNALVKLDGDLKAGVILTVGARRDRQAVSLLAPLAGDEDAEVAEAALYALGQIGGADALRALQAASVPEGLKRYRFHALLLCAERMATEGQPADASPAYRAVYEQSDDAVIKAAALRGILASDQGEAVPLITAALKGESVKLRVSAAKAVCELGATEVLSPILSELSTLPVDAQTTILGMVSDKAALPSVLAAAKSSEDAVRVAALGALGRLGDAAVVPLLLEIAAAGGGSEQAAARASLQELRGKDVDPALVAAAQTGQTALRLEAIRALAARTATAAVPILLKLADDADPTVQTEAVGALGVLAGCQALPGLLNLLAETKSEELRGALERATTATCQRIRTLHHDWAAERVLAAMPGQSPEVRCSLLRVLARIPTARAIEGLRTALGDADAAVKDAAIRGLADWPDAAAIEDLLGIARSAESQVHKVLALRGLMRLAGLPSGRPAQETVKLLAEAMALAPRVEEKKTVLAALAEINHAAALDLAVSLLAEKDLEVEAAAAVVKIAKGIQRADPDAAAAAVRKVLDVATAPAARQLAESAMIIADNLVNIAPQGTATSPDDLDKDGAAGGDQAAIDGDDGTYWDEEDGKELYRLLVTFKQPERVAAVSILGYGHHNYAPKDFEIVCDGKAVKKVENAQYDNNFLIVGLDEVTCTTVELKITGYYGQSPALRELGIYRPATPR